MKRYIKSAWYTGEPSNFNSKGHSVYSNPENYKEKQDQIIDFIESMEDYYPDGWYKPNKTNSIVQVQSKVWKEFKGENKYFKFDLWEDDKSIDDQCDDFALWTSKYCDRDRF